MKNETWVALDRWARWLHLYTGLFLLPWMLIYAASALLLNHREWFIQAFQVAPPRWEEVSSKEFVPDDSFPRLPEQQAAVILERVGLDGPHRILPSPNTGPMTIFRACASGAYRVTWYRQRSRLTVERQVPFSFFRLVHVLHFQHGYSQPYFAHLTWAFVVDAVSVSIVLWGLSGVYLWARRPRQRLAGAACAILGSLLFMGLAILLCS